MRILLSFLFIFALFYHNAHADGSNDSCNGEVIGEVNDIAGTFSYVTHTEAGIVNDSTDQLDYYQFTPGQAGTITIDYTSIDNTDVKVSIVSCDGDEVLDLSNNNSATTTFNILDTDTVFMRIEPRKTYDQDYAAAITFTKATTPLCSSTGMTSGDREFCLRKRITLQGGMTTVGNTILVAPAGQDTDGDDEGDVNNCATYTNGPFIVDAPTANNYWYLCNYEQDGQTNATTAELNIPSTATVEWAGLYWQALVAKGTILNTMSPDIKKGAGAYVDISGYDKLDFKEDDGKTDYTNYSAFKDLTTLFQSNSWGEGNYTVANIPVQEGKLSNLGTFGAWSLVVIYSDDSGTYKNFSVFDGYKVVKDSSGYRDVQIDVDGFYTPKSGDIAAKVSIFAGEGDKYWTNDYLQALNLGGGLSTIPGGSQTFNSSISGGGARLPFVTNNMGIDIQTHDIGTLSGYNLLTNEQSSIEFHFTSTQDTYWPSMIAFETDIHIPLLCYDYSYSQNGSDITEDNNGSIYVTPHLSGDLVNAEPIYMQVFIRNDEIGSLANDIVFRLVDLNTTQVQFPTNTTDLDLQKTDPNSITYQPVTDIDILTSSDLQFGYTQLLDYQEGVYSSFNLQPSSDGAIHVPLTMFVDFNFTISGQSFALNNLPLKDEVPLCSSGSYEYKPQFGAFNIVHEDNYINNGGIYNIPTQVSERGDDFLIIAHDTTDSSTIHDEKNVSTVVTVELIDIGSFHDASIACNDPGSSITPRVQLIFDNNVSRSAFNMTTLQAAIDDGQISDQIGTVTTPIATAQEWWSHARKNTAFRINYNAVTDDGDLVKLERIDGASGVHYNVSNFNAVVALGNCVNDVDGNLGNTDTTAQFCSNSGTAYNSAMSPAELAVCMECVYGYNVTYECSRDNFAIRPEAFDIKIYDNDESTNAADPKVTVPLIADIAAGYQYRYDVNATTHSGSDGVSGYTRSYLLPGPDHNITYYWRPTTSLTGCNNTDDVSPKIYLYNGTAANYRNSSPNVGRYELEMRDSTWTNVDQIAPHHSTTGYSNLPDCNVNSSAVPSTGTALTGSNIGCIVSSNHTNSDAGITYSDYNVTVHPYDFNVTDAMKPVRFNKGVNGTLVSANDYVYMNNVLNDANMSVRYEGIIRAVGADNGTLSNFVADCYAQNVNLDINTSALPSTPLFNYRLLENNATGSIISDTNGNNGGAAVLPGAMIPAANFTQGYLGAADMQYHLNFDRNVSGAINPISLTYGDFNVSCSNLADCQSYADMTTTHNPNGGINTNASVTHIYGRVHTPRQRVANPNPALNANATIPLYYEFYCDSATGCNIGTYATVPAAAPNALSPIGLLSPDDVRWYSQALHTIAEDGNASATQARSAADDALITTKVINAGAQSANYTYNGNKGYPYKATIEVSAPAWLLYNRFNVAASVNEFELEFFSSGRFSGTDASGVNMDANTSINVNRRIQW